MSNFGATFRKARETAGLPLEKIAAETRISTRFLLAIESENFHQLPGGIFNRGFIRAYADHLKIDAEQALSDYERLSATTEEPLDALRSVERASTRRSERHLYPLVAAILVLAVITYYALTRTHAKPEAPAPQPAVAQATTPLEAAPADVETAKAAPIEAPTPETAAAATPVALPAAPLATKAVAESSTIVLDVTIKNPAWLRITTDGTVVLSENLQPGDTRRFSAERSIDVKIGNAGGASFKVNGRDMGQLGTEGQVREYKITPENAGQIQG